MKRFYCVICGKSKRVRRLPDDIAFSTHEDRVSQCRWHSSGKSHSQFVRDSRVPGAPARPRYQKAKPVIAAPKPQKKGRRESSAA